MKLNYERQSEGGNHEYHNTYRQTLNPVACNNNSEALNNFKERNFIKDTPGCHSKMTCPNQKPQWS